MFSETFQVILATLHGYVNCGLSRILELMLDIFCSSLQVCYLRREAYLRVCQGVILLREKKGVMLIVHMMLLKTFFFYSWNGAVEILKQLLVDV